MDETKKRERSREGRGRRVFAGAGKRMKKERAKGRTGVRGKGREGERALGIVSMTYVALTLSAKRL